MHQFLPGQGPHRSLLICGFRMGISDLAASLNETHAEIYKKKAQLRKTSEKI